jgi:hypothetical protein
MSEPHIRQPATIIIVEIFPGFPGRLTQTPTVPTVSLLHFVSEMYWDVSSTHGGTVTSPVSGRATTLRPNGHATPTLGARRPEIQAQDRICGSAQKLIHDREKRDRLERKKESTER